MKAVILAAGRGSRMGSLTEQRPKPLIKVGGKALIEHALSALPPIVTEYVVVVGYRGNDLKSFLGHRYHEHRISYVQQERRGTGGALYSTRSHLADTDLFFVIGADDIFGVMELDVLVCGTPSYGVTYGVPRSKSTHGVEFDESGFLTNYRTVSFGVPRFYGVGAYVVSPEIFSTPLHRLANGEYSIPHSLYACSFPIRVCQISRWLPVNTPEDIEYAETVLSSW